MSVFNVVTKELRRLLEEWEPKLLLMPDDRISLKSSGVANFNKFL